MTTPKTVQFDLNYRGSNSINLIKIARNAFGIGLIEARDLVNAAHGGNTARSVRATETQFGAFVAAILADEVVSLAEVRMNNVTVFTVPPQTIVFDYTKPAPRQNW